MKFDVADRVSRPDGQASSPGTTRKDSTIPDRKITRPMASVAVYLADFCFGRGKGEGRLSSGFESYIFPLWFRTQIERGRTNKLLNIRRKRSRCVHFFL